MYIFAVYFHVYSILIASHTRFYIFFFFLMIRRPPRSTLDRSSAASDVYKRQILYLQIFFNKVRFTIAQNNRNDVIEKIVSLAKRRGFVFQSSEIYGGLNGCWDYGPLGVELLNLSLIHISEPHETVLDIVCRLLLAKKKKAKNP